MLAQLQSSIVVPKLVKNPRMTFTEFDPERFAIEDDNSKGYFAKHNWVLIGSLGDPETWDGKVLIAKRKSIKGSGDGLAGTLIDMNVMQEILY